MGGSTTYEIKGDEIRAGAGQLSPTPSGSIEETDTKLIALNKEAASLALGVRRSGEHWAEKAWEFGLWLNYAKQQGAHGTWISRLQGLGINLNTANKYMALAKSYDRTNLLTARNVTHAMELAGVRKPEPIKADSNDHTTKIRLPDSLEVIGADFARWKRNNFDQRIDKASGALLLAWHDALKPMHETYEVVSKALRIGPQ